MLWHHQDGELGPANPMPPVSIWEWGNSRRNTSWPLSLDQGSPIKTGRACFLYPSFLFLCAVHRAHSQALTEFFSLRGKEVPVQRLLFVAFLHGNSCYRKLELGMVAHKPETLETAPAGAAEEWILIYSQAEFRSAATVRSGCHLG